jgi:polyhydroxybutyrate depolymerase
LIVTGVATVGAAAALGVLGARERKRVAAGSLRIGKRLRTFRVHLPQDYDGNTELPLLLVLHDALESGSIAEAYTGMSDLADRERFIAVYPDAVARRWSLSKAKRKLPPAGVDDVAFVDRLITHLLANYAIDRQRVFATGMGVGGLVCYALMGGLPRRIRAIAPVAAVLPVDVEAQLRLQPPKPVLAINGDQDAILSWEGGGTGARLVSIPINTFLRLWNGCEGPPEVSYVPLGEHFNATRARHEIYRRPDGSTPVEFYAIDAGGHTWPGARRGVPERLVGRTNRDLQASDVIVEFFRRHGTW